VSTGNWAFIFARGGSKGLPRKNIRPLRGVPLIAWSIRCAQDCGIFDRIVVSTDDAEIAEVARAHGAEVPFTRPARLASDTSPEWEAWRHAVTALPDVGRFVSLPATAPLRSPDDVLAAVDRHQEGGWDAVLAVTPAHRHPSFNMVGLDPDGRARVLMPAGNGIARRQDAPPAYDVTTVAYVTTPRYILQASALFDGAVGTVLVPRERAVDIDDEVDFAVAETLLRRTMEAT
jgi:CMP-N-acetylneuraminic acid synthetase